MRASRMIAAGLGLVALIAGGWGIASCTDAHLYGKGIDDPSANRLGLTGRVCTDDPRKAGFPVKVLFLVDTAAGPMFSSFDVELQRLNALRESLSIHEGNESFEFAVLGFGANARVLAPEEEYFTRNPGELQNAIAQLAIPQGCIANKCRDYYDGFELAESVIEGDMANLLAGERSRTQYVVVLLTGGPPDPLNCSYDCCEPDDEECDFSTCVEDWDCTTELHEDAIFALRQDIENQGALSFSLHALQIAAPDPLQKDPGPELDAVQGLLEKLAFAGGGTYARFDSPDAITLEKVGLLKLSSVLEAKSLIVTNTSTLPGMDGALTDSDGDGIDDETEAQLGSSPVARDTDLDGIGDLVETMISFDPTVPDEIPNVCLELEGHPYYSDLDVDYLNECEELLMGTDPTLTDTDGDAIPDWMEVVFGTDYLHADALADSDWDGTPNGDELINHTDPRSSDANSHLASAYRYEVTDEGLVKEPSVFSPGTIPGVTVTDAGVDTTGGLGTLRYILGQDAMLSWQDPADGAPGPSQVIDGAGTYQLPSSSVVSGGLERWINVDVQPGQLPPFDGEEQLLVEIAERHCLSFTVRNIELVETLGEGDESGKNDVFIYFAESPAGRMTLPGLFRAVHIPVVYHPETGREPPEALIEVQDGEFAAIGY